MAGVRKDHWSGLVLLAATGLVPLPAAAEVGVSVTAALPSVAVWRSPQCGCCGDWIEHMEAAGFQVEDHLHGDMAGLKARLGIPAPLASCHTARVGDYVLEGHVPADDVKRLLHEGRPGRGLLVPGMPMGSPGMEMPGIPADPYEVLWLDEAGELSVFARHGED